MIANGPIAHTNVKVPQTFLTPEMLRSQCPAAYATQPADNVSENYRFVSSERIIERLATRGLFPVSVKSPVRKANGRTGQLVPSSYGPHLITFEPKYDNLAPVLGEGRIQVNLLNSHNRSRRLVLRGGFFRLVCLNGLMIGEVASGLTLTHLESHMQHVDEQIDQVLLTAERMVPLIQNMRSRELTRKEQTAFAETAMGLRFGPRKLWRVTTDAVLAPRRDEDNRPTLWAVFNRVQENLVKGGLRNERTPMPTMPLTRPLQTFKFNTELWTAAEQFLN